MRIGVGVQPADQSGEIGFGQGDAAGGGFAADVQEDGGAAAGHGGGTIVVFHGDGQRIVGADAAERFGGGQSLSSCRPPIGCRSGSQGSSTQ